MCLAMTDFHSQNNLNALIFDLDGTLTLTQHFHYEAFTRVFGKAGLRYTQEDDQNFAGKGSRSIFPEFFLKHGRTLTESEVEDFSKQKAEIYKQILKSSEVKEVPGARDFVRRMKERGLKIAIGTGNKPYVIDYILQKTGMTEFIDVILANKYVKHSKPDPEMFLMAAHRLNTLPQECLVFEDAVNGIEAARLAGMTSIGLTTGVGAEKLLATGAIATIQSYNEVTDEVLTNIAESIKSKE